MSNPTCPYCLKENKFSPIGALVTPRQGVDVVCICPSCSNPLVLSFCILPGRIGLEILFKREWVEHD